MICNNKKQVFMGGSPKAKSTDFTPAFFLLQDNGADRVPGQPERQFLQLAVGEQAGLGADHRPGM